MNSDKDKPDLQSLINSYQETRAPIGFTERVTAHLDHDRKTKYDSVATVLTHLWGFHKIAVASTFAAVVLVSFSVIHSIDDNKPDIQLVSQDQPGSTSTKPAGTDSREADTTTITQLHKGVGNDSITDTSLLRTSPPSKTVDNPIAVAKLSNEEIDRFFSHPESTEEDNLAVLTDISIWLIEQPDVAMPDISNIPDITDIDLYFETT